MFGTLMVPASSYLSPLFTLDGMIDLVCLPMAVCLALLMLYDIAALPGIFIGLMLYFSNGFGIDSILVISTWFLFSLTICWLGYRAQAKRKWPTGYSSMWTQRSRIFWLVIVLPLMIVMGYQLLVNFELLPSEIGLHRDQTFTLRTLLYYQGVLLACLACVQPFYYLTRLLTKPSYFYTLKNRAKKEMSSHVNWLEAFLWLGSLGVITRLLSYDYNEQNIFLSNHPVSLLLPVMLYGAIRFGFIISGTVWAVVLVILLQNYPGMIYSVNEYPSLTFNMSLLVMFTITVMLVATISTRQRVLHLKAKRLSLVDPLTGLPNLRWLARDLEKHDSSTLCFIRMANLDVLSRVYGIQLRIRFKQKLEQALRPILSENECVYQLPDYDLALRLNSQDSEQTLSEIQTTLDQFRLLWNDMPVHPHYGVGYCEVKSPVRHLNSLLGELSSAAEEALTLGWPQSVDLKYDQLQEHIQQRVNLLHQVQRALDHNSFNLMVEPICGFRGETFYEVHVNLRTDSGQQVDPKEFMSVVHEFGLSYEVDLWVLDQTMAFVQAHRGAMPSLRFSVHLSAESICRPSLAKDVRRILQRHQIEPYQVILGMTESQLLHDNTQAMITLYQLRESGCQIALEGFGNGFANYNRLKEFQADIMKIDGGFITHILDNVLDYSIVESMCQVARLKRMTVIAKNVDKEEQRIVLRKLGVDYIQGKLVGLPQPLSSLQ